MQIRKQLKHTMAALAAAALLTIGGLSSIGHAAPTTGGEGTTLRQAGERHHILIGCALMSHQLDDPKEYLRETPAKKAIGDDYLVKAFQFAHEADPDVELYYNDYSNENPGKRDNTIKLIRELKKAGARIDAIGLQAHFATQYQNSPKLLDE